MADFPFFGVRKWRVVGKNEGLVGILEHLVGIFHRLVGKKRTLVGKHKFYPKKPLLVFNSGSK